MLIHASQKIGKYLVEELGYVLVDNGDIKLVQTITIKVQHLG